MFLEPYTPPCSETLGKSKVLLCPLEASSVAKDATQEVVGNWGYGVCNNFLHKHNKILACSDPSNTQEGDI